MRRGEAVHLVVELEQERCRWIMELDGGAIRTSIEAEWSAHNRKRLMRKGILLMVADRVRPESTDYEHGGSGLGAERTHHRPPPPPPPPPPPGAEVRPHRADESSRATWPDTWEWIREWFWTGLQEVGEDGRKKQFTGLPVVLRHDERIMMHATAGRADLRGEVMERLSRSTRS